MKCSACDGDGWTVEPVCCGRPSEHGACCGDPDPEQAQCERCQGTGEIPDGETLMESLITEDMITRAVEASNPMRPLGREEARLILVMAFNPKIPARRKSVTTYRDHEFFNHQHNSWQPDRRQSRQSDIGLPTKIEVLDK